MTLDKEKDIPEGPLYYYVFNTLLYCLLVLHIYWWVLMYRMLVKQIQDRGKLSDDVRSGKLNCPICSFIVYQLQYFSPAIVCFSYILRYSSLEVAKWEG